MPRTARRLRRVMAQQRTSGLHYHDPDGFCLQVEACAGTGGLQETQRGHLVHHRATMSGATGAVFECRVSLRSSCRLGQLLLGPFGGYPHRLVRPSRGLFFFSP